MLNVTVETLEGTMMDLGEFCCERCLDEYLGHNEEWQKEWRGFSVTEVSGDDDEFDGTPSVSSMGLSKDWK